MLTDNQRGKAFAHGDRFIDRAHRTITQHLHAVDDAAEFAHQIGDLAVHAIEFGGRNQFLRGFQMTRGQQRQIAVDAILIVGFRHPGGIEQKIGDLRHSGNDGRDGAVLCLKSNQIAGSFHTGGGTDAGAAEFHYEQMIQVTFL